MDRIIEDENIDFENDQDDEEIPEIIGSKSPSIFPFYWVEISSTSITKNLNKLHFPNRNSHAGVITKNNLLLIFGGQTIQNMIVSTIIEYDIGRRIWKNLPFEGTRPNCLRSHSCVYYSAREEIWLFGGGIYLNI